MITTCLFLLFFSLSLSSEKIQRSTMGLLNKIYCPRKQRKKRENEWEKEGKFVPVVDSGKAAAEREMDVCPGLENA